MPKENNPNKTYKSLITPNNVPNKVSLDFGNSVVDLDVRQNFDETVSLIYPDSQDVVASYESMDEFLKNFDRLREHRG